MPAPTLSPTAPARRAPSASAPYAVFAELGRSQVPMQPGTNRRRFNVVNLDHGGAFIAYEEDNALVALARGTYRIRGYSITTFRPARIIFLSRLSSTACYLQ
jgi:hypothetical protein